MPKKIKVGILTNKTGAHVGAYLNALRDTEACESVVLADPDGHWVESARGSGATTSALIIIQNT